MRPSLQFMCTADGIERFLTRLQATNRGKRLMCEILSRFDSQMVSVVKT